MRVTLNVYNPQVDEQESLLTLDVFPEWTLGTLRASVSDEIQVPATAQHFYHNGRLLADDSQTMEQLQITDGDLLALHVRSNKAATVGQGERARQEQAPSPAQGRPRPQGGSGDSEVIRLQVLGNPALRQKLEQQVPDLAEAINDPDRFAHVLRESQDREQRERLERQREIERLNDDPFDIEAQTRIEEIIRQQQVMENLQSAMEHNPEVFGRVHMLYAKVEVNGHQVKALIDSGAQATIMSPRCAEACGIMRLVDERFAGIARGVGTANILGRVHSAQIKIGSLYLPCSFTVMQGKSVDLLLGLDMLKRYQASLDLGRDMLIIQGVEIPFLGEAEIPKDEEEAVTQEPTVPGPAGTVIGQESGVVMPAPGQAQTQATGSQQSIRPSVPQPVLTPTPAAPAGDVGSSAPSGSSVQTASPSNIESLISMGATREQAIQALQASGDNVEMAASLIFF